MLGLLTGTTGTASNRKLVPGPQNEEWERWIVIKEPWLVRMEPSKKGNVVFNRSRPRKKKNKRKWSVWLWQSVKWTELKWKKEDWCWSSFVLIPPLILVTTEVAVEGCTTLRTTSTYFKLVHLLLTLIHWYCTPHSKGSSEIYWSVSKFYCSFFSFPSAARYIFRFTTSLLKSGKIFASGLNYFDLGPRRRGILYGHINKVAV